MLRVQLRNGTTQSVRNVHSARSVEREKENQWNRDHRKKAESDVATLTRQVQLLTHQRDEAREAVDQSQLRFMRGVPPDKSRKFRVKLGVPCDGVGGIRFVECVGEEVLES